MHRTIVEKADLAKEGSYLLHLYLSGERAITVGRLGTIKFSRGYYYYAGSAMGGLKSRLLRHIRQEKNIHWHIDYLLKYAEIECISVFETGEKLECTVAGLLAANYPVIRKFGSSDCTCPGHLLYSDTDSTPEIHSLFIDAGIPFRVLDTDI